MHAFPSLLRLKFLLFSASLLFAKDKAEASQQRQEHCNQQSANQTTTRTLANIPTFSAADETTSSPLWQRHKLAQNAAAIPAMQSRSQRSKSSKRVQREAAPKTAAAEENRQATNPQPADGENLPFNPTSALSPASAKTAPQDQDKAVGQGQSLVNSLCASCHSTMLVNNARKTGGDWRKTLSKMESQGMPKLPPAWRERLVRYLATSLGISDGNLRQNYSPWADRRNANPLW